ncbi:MAG TPA: ROK family protein [Candidatus Saccharimonadales bacterium]|nr:ROK family protein [Candidatus Saccharimonadales bacterium]
MVSTRQVQKTLIGVDIGASKILVVAGNSQPEIENSMKIATPDNGGQAVIEITHLIEQVAGGQPIAGIHVASPGPIDRAKGTILKTPNMNWEPLPIVEQLRNHFRVPVALEKDADAAALAEATIGAGKGQSSVLYVTISTGVGIGIVINGELYHGAHDPEGGHIQIMAEGKSEELETAVAGPAMKRRFGQYGYEITDPKIWDEYAKDVATGLYDLIITLSPSIVVMGGGVNVHFRKFEQPLLMHLRALKPINPLPPIVPAKYMETAVAYGTLILASHLVK